MLTPIFTKDDVSVGDMVRVKAPEDRKEWPDWLEDMDELGGEFVDVVSIGNKTFFGNSGGEWKFSYEWITEIKKKGEKMSTEVKEFDFYVEKNGKKYGFNEFNLIDIYNRKPSQSHEFDKEFTKLLEEWDETPFDKIRDKEDFEYYDTLMNNILWLIEQGLGEKIKKKETPLVPGIILHKSYNKNQRVMYTADNKFLIIEWPSSPQSVGGYYHGGVKAGTIEEFKQESRFDCVIEE